MKRRGPLSPLRPAPVRLPFGAMSERLTIVRKTPAWDEKEASCRARTALLLFACEATATDGVVPPE